MKKRPQNEPGSGSPPSMTKTVLLISGNPISRNSYRDILAEHGFRVLPSTGKKKELINLQTAFSAVLVDVDVYPSDAVSQCRLMHQRFPDTPIIVAEPTHLKSIHRSQLEKYAFALLHKPCEPGHLLAALTGGSRFHLLTRKNQELSNYYKSSPIPKIPHGESMMSQRLAEQIASAAETNAPIFLAGEPGTDKRRLAQWIHQASSLSGEGFYHIVCSETSCDLQQRELFGGGSDSQCQELGKLALFSSGTVFLDRIEALAAPVQRKLAKYVATRLPGPIARKKKTPRGRILLATEMEPRMAMENGFIGEGFMPILNSIAFSIPPLRTRIGDISLFCQEIMSRLRVPRHKSRPVLSERALLKLKEHHWPGNFTELETVLFHAVESAANNVIREEDIVFPSRFDLTDLAAATRRDERERLDVISALTEAGGNRKEAAKNYGVSERTMYNLIKRYGIDIDEFIE